MSHFTVLVIGDNPENQLDPFDENLELPRYLEKTKAELIQESKDNIKHYRDTTYAEYLKNPEEYAKNHTNESHLIYLTEEFPKQLKWSDEEHYQVAIKWYEEEDIDEEGNVYSICNPQGKWDWYSLGGRWSGRVIELKEGTSGTEGTSGVFDNEIGVDQTRKGDIANINKITAYAVIKNSKWYEKGEMGWFGMSSNEVTQEKWDAEIRTLLEDVSDDTLISIYDCHV